MLRQMARLALGLTGFAKFSRTEKGKPILLLGEDVIPGWDFNVSHQGAFTVLAAEKGRKYTTF